MNKKVLIIDSDKRSVDLVKETLTPLGYEIASKANINSGLRLINKFNLVILNPSISSNGLSSIKKIQSGNPDALIILAVPEGKLDASVTVRERIFECIEKPFKSEELKTLIEKAYNFLFKKDEFKSRDYKLCSLKEFLEAKLHKYVSRMSHLERANLYDTVISEVEKALFSIVMKETNGNQLRTAKILGINRNTLCKKLKEYNLI